MKIAEILGLPEGSINGPVSGFVKVVFDKREGEFGPFQSFIISDETGEVEVSVGKSGPFLTVLDKGKQFTVSSKMSNYGATKNQMVGLKVAKITEGKNAGKNKLKVGAANVSVGGSSAQGGSPVQSQVTPLVGQTVQIQPQESQDQRIRSIDFWSAAKVWAEVAPHFKEKKLTPEGCFAFCAELVIYKNTFVKEGIIGTAKGLFEAKEVEVKTAEAGEDPFQ